jgi:hypothetical protein
VVNWSARWRQTWQRNWWNKSLIWTWWLVVFFLIWIYKVWHRIFRIKRSEIYFSGRRWRWLCIDWLENFLSPLNAELNPIRHLLALVGARHIVHVSRVRVNPLNAELNPIRHLLALVGARHIVHVSRIRVNPLNADLNPIRHLLALVGARHIVHVSRIIFKANLSASHLSLIDHLAKGRG